MHLKRKLTYLIKKDGAFVGFLKVAFSVLVGSSECSFQMAEQFALDSAFGDGTTVDGNKFLVLPVAVVVYDMREDILTNPTLARNENAEVGGCHLGCFAYGKLQFGVVAHNVVSCF